MDLDRVTVLAKLLVEQESLVAVLEEDLKNAKAAALKTKREDLPELMREFGLLELRLDTGQRIEVKEDIECKIPENRRTEAMAWLNGHGFGGLIKTVVTVEFGRGEIETAEQLAGKLIDDGLPAVALETVHPATLKAFVNEQLAAGQSVPFDLFGVFPYSFAKLTKK